MIQARIPEAILRELPVGSATAPLLEAARTCSDPYLHPDLAAWIRRNGFHEGEAVQLLPTIVPTPPEQPRVVVRRVVRGRRRLLRAGAALLALSLVLPLAIGNAMPGMADDPDVGRLAITLTAGAFWLGLQLAPVVLLSLLALLFAHSDRGIAYLDGSALQLLAVLLLSYGATVGGFALIARARGYSAWFGLLGVISLGFRDRNRP